MTEYICWWYFQEWVQYSLQQIQMLSKGIWIQCMLLVEAIVLKWRLAVSFKPISCFLFSKQICQEDDYD